MQEKFPKFLENRLTKIYGEEEKNKIIEGYKRKRVVTFRVNTLKSNTEKIKNFLENKKIIFKEVSWNKEAFIIENLKEEEIKKLLIYENGEIYLQSLSSMIPPIILNPKENENILDMAAAPGGKTTEIAALSQNEAMITACEKNKIRAERLKYNLNKQGATRVNVMVEDARKLDNFFSFDKILLDSPCSGSGTFNVFEEKFTEELIKRSVKLQEELLIKGLKILKPGGELVYSTCSILQEENEEVINKALGIVKNIEIVPIEDIFKEIPKIPNSINGTICIKPDINYEGFFVAKLRRRK